MYFETKLGEEDQSFGSDCRCYFVSICATFSTRELAILSEQDLTHKTLLDRYPMDGWATEDLGKNALKVRALLDGRTDKYSFETFDEAKQYEDDIRGVLAQFAQYLDRGGKPYETGIKGFMRKIFNCWSNEFYGINGELTKD